MKRLVGLLHNMIYNECNLKIIFKIVIKINDRCEMVSVVLISIYAFADDPYR